MLNHCFHCQSPAIDRSEVKAGVFGPEISCVCRECGTAWAEIQGWSNHIQQELAV